MNKIVLLMIGYIPNLIIGINWVGVEMYGGIA